MCVLLRETASWRRRTADGNLGYTRVPGVSGRVNCDTRVPGVSGRVNHDGVPNRESIRGTSVFEEVLSRDVLLSRKYCARINRTSLSSLFLPWLYYDPSILPSRNEDEHPKKNEHPAPSILATLPQERRQDCLLPVSENCPMR